LGLSCFHVGRTKATEASDRNDTSYYRCGIGTALLKRGLDWASKRDYRSVVAISGIDAFPAYNNWAGTLPLKVYLRVGFNVLARLDAQSAVPGHLAARAAEIESSNLQMAAVIWQAST
jgi:hypothetical protein